MKRLSIRRRFVRIPVPSVSFTMIHKGSIKKRLFTSIPTLHRIINTEDPDFGAGEEWIIPAGKLTRSVNFSYQVLCIGIRQIILSWTAPSTSRISKATTGPTRTSPAMTSQLSPIPSTTPLKNHNETRPADKTASFFPRLNVA